MWTPTFGPKARMFRQTISSTELRSIGYEEEHRLLEVEFQNGRVYNYQQVPHTVYSALISASSKGRYFNSQIRDLFRCNRVM
jgi:hypothetical protein